MPNIIYTYFNDSDLCLIDSFLFDMGAVFLNKNNERINKLPFSESGRSEISISLENNTVIIFSPCVIKDFKIHEGYFAALDNPSSISTFLIIKKYIKNTFLYSQKNRCYYGNGIYNDWLNFKYIFPIMLESENINIDCKEAYAIFDDLLEKGYKLYPNNVRLRDTDKDFMFSNEIIISPQAAKITKTIHRKTFIHYEYGSECVFVYKDSKRGFYCFVFDKRLLNGSNDFFTDLYDLIRKTGGRGDGSPKPSL